MDRGPRKLPNTSSRLIAMATSLVGTLEAVQKHMQCSDVEFLAYRSGQQEPSWDQLSRLVDLIVKEQNKVIQKNRELLAEIRRNRA